MSASIESYGLIGDCQTAALVGRDGSIDWLCWPRFDSDALFAKLLGGQSNGFWLICPSHAVTSTRRCYRTDTLILETTFETDGGRATLIDFMLPRGASSDLIRLVRGDEGEVAMCMELMMRFGYGATTPWVTRLKDGGIKAVAGPDMAVLRTPVAIRGENFKTVAQFTVAKGKTVAFVLSYGPSHLPMPSPVEPLAALDKCETFWCDWTNRTKTADCGPYTEAVKRSLITLKALTYLPTGGIVAAPTTSLPEQPGRRAQLGLSLLLAARRHALTLLALMNAGIYDEAAAWRDWLLRAVAGSPDEMQIMYGLAGERRLTELELDWLPGYEDSKPVRIGNAAHEQFQLDVYGEVMDAFEQSRKGGLACDRRRLGPPARYWSSTSPRSGSSPTRASGRCAVRRGTSPTPRSWPGWRSTARSRRVEMHGLEGPVEQWRAAARQDPQARSAARASTRAATLSAQSYGSQRARRQPAADRADRLRAARRPALHRHRRGDRARTERSTASSAATAPTRSMTGSSRAKAPSWPAASGWPTPTPRSAASPTPRSCSSACCRSATTSACWPRSTTPGRSVCRGTSRRPSAMSP